MPQII